MELLQYLEAWHPEKSQSIISKIGEILCTIENSASETQELALQNLKEHHGFALLGFAEQMASLAVRENDPEISRIGLIATSIASRILYIKESLPIVAILCDSLERLGHGEQFVLFNIPRIQSNDHNLFLSCFMKRLKVDRQIEEMGYEARDDNGFIYKRTW